MLAALGARVLLLVGGGWAERLPPATLLGLAWLGGSLAALALGLSDSLAGAIVAYVLFVALVAFCSVPLSLWASRIADDAGSAGPDRATVFAVCKVCQMGVTLLVLAGLGVLEPRVGMAGLMWGGGLLGLPCALAALRVGARLPERSGRTAHSSTRA